ncbi:hypothetical protein CCP2SC5_1860004 [Azospirillaceae bacterium]
MLEGVVGKDAAEFLCKMYGREIIHIPKARRWRGLKHAILDGKDGARETSRILDCSEGYVYQVRAKAQNRMPPPLFAWADKPR